MDESSKQRAVDKLKRATALARVITGPSAMMDKPVIAVTRVAVDLILEELAARGRPDRLGRPGGTPHGELPWG
jgi:hypothetical protein